MLGFAALLSSSLARAHDPPRAVELAWSSTAAEEARPVVLTNRGLIFLDGQVVGAPIALRCNEAYGLTPATVPLLLVEPTSGALVMVAPTWVGATLDRGCGFQKSFELAPGIVFGGIARLASSAGALLVSTVETEGISRVLRSSDYGSNWSLVSENAPDELYTAFAAAPSDPDQIFASGYHADRVARTLTSLWARSADGGATWEHQELPNKRTPFAVHPTEPNTVFAWENVDAQGTAVRVLRSADGGDTFETAVEVSSVSAFAATPDGAELWLGGGRDVGLWHSTDGGRSFARVHEEIQDVHCLAYRAGTLWMCGNMVGNHEGIWTWDAAQSSWHTELLFEEVSEPVACADEAAAGVCELPWFDWQVEIMTAPDDAGVPDAGQPDAGMPEPSAPDAGAPDAGAPKPPKKKPDCTVAAGTPGSSLSLLLLALATLWRGALRLRARQD